MMQQREQKGQKENGKSQKARIICQLLKKGSLIKKLMIILQSQESIFIVELIYLNTIQTT
jgi:hypothetical protein